jgi:predicted TIM-barrel fold metal-dependent hydrolase
MREIAASNRYVYEAARRHPDRILGFGWVDPHLGIHQMKDEIRRCAEEYGFHGVKLNGAQNSFYIDSPTLALPLIEAIAATGRLLAFHIGTDAYEATHPYRLGKIASMFPDTQILMVHTGGVGFSDLSSAAIEVITQHPNITGIGSALRHVNVLKALKSLGAHRICFGSDFPFNLMYVEVAAYRALMDGELTEAEQGLVWSGNIARLIGLDVS